MARHWVLSGIWIAVGLIFTFLIGVYSEQIREIISSATGFTDTTVIFYFVLGTILLIFFGTLFYIGFLIYSKFFKIDVVIQKDSLSFVKYPYLAGSHGNLQPYTNKSYGDIMVHNKSKSRINECSLEISLRKDNMDIYKSKVLSSDSTPPNPISVSIDGEGDKGFCPVSLRLDSFQAFLPHDSLGQAGNFTGPLIANGSYEIFGRILIEGKCGKWVSLGNIAIPSDLVDKAKVPNDIQVIIDQGGFAVYAELFQGKVRAKFFGDFTDGDVNRTLNGLKKQKFQVDMTVEENGKLRKIDYRPAFLLM
jgi:hypothetical protein